MWISSSFGPTSDVHGLCAGWKRGEGRNTRENRWIGNDHYLQHLPRAGIERCRPNSADRRTLTNYIVRQLYEFQHSGRTGSASALMKQTVEKLSQDDMIALAAYVGSLEP